MSGGSRVSRISENVRKMIQNIKEMTGNDNDEEIYAMLKECSMDPNETVQKLLLQDTFHEVKRRKDKKKESVNNPEPVDSRWRSGPPGQIGRGGRGSHFSRHGAGSGGRNSSLGKENGTYQAFNASLLAAREMKNRGATTGASSLTIMVNGPVSTGIVSGGKSDSHTSQASAGGGGRRPAVSSSRHSHPDASKDFNMTVVAREAVRESPASSKDSSVYVTSGSMSAVDSSVSDPLLVSSMDSRVPAVGSQQTPVEPDSKPSAESRSNASKLGSKSHGGGKSQHLEFTQSSSISVHGSSSSSRPSSNYGSRLHQTTGSLKGHSKEWKPKSTNTNAVQGPKISSAIEEPPALVDVGPCSQPVESVCNPKETTAELQKELEKLHVRDAQHVIIPSHIHVPESVRCGLSFGSFNAAFSANSTPINEAESEKFSEPTSDCSQGAEVTVVEQTVSNENDLVPSEEREYADNPQSSKLITESLEHGDTNTTSSSVLDMNDLKEETPAAPQNSVVHTSTFGFGLMPNLLGSTLATIESSDTHGRDSSRVPNIVHPVDPVSFYGQFYRSGADNDGRISPFPSSGIAPKHNMNSTMLSPLTSQSLQEGGNSLVLSTGVQAPVATQATGVVQSSIAFTQPPVPIFRQPAGLHIPHYPPNYVPYGHYFSPFYVPPPALHQFLNSNAFPQQAQVGSVYPGQASAAATGLKYPIPQYKPGNNSGNTMPIGVAGSFGPYGTTPTGYNPGSAAVAGNPAGNEDLAASQFKENNVYMNSQQSEGSAVWIAAPGRDLPSLQANPFYNLPPQGQPVTFPPTQAGHGSFAGVYHPAQAVTAGTIHPFLQQSQQMGGGVDMAGATTSVYQQQQHTGVNWPSNY